VDASITNTCIIICSYINMRSKGWSHLIILPVSVVFTSLLLDVFSTSKNAVLCRLRVRSSLQILRTADECSKNWGFDFAYLAFDQCSSIRCWNVLTGWRTRRRTGRANLADWKQSRPIKCVMVTAVRQKISTYYNKPHVNTRNIISLTGNEKGKGLQLDTIWSSPHN